MLKYHTAFDRHQQPTCSFYRERLIKNTTQAYWMGEVHEVIPPFGEVIYSDIAISHQKKQTAYTSRNLNIYQNLLSQGKTLSPRSQYYYGRELYYHQNHQEALVVFKNFLAAPDGWIENTIEACQLAAQCCYQLMRQEEALSCLLYSLAFDTPRAEICCDIGNHFLSQNDLSLAIYWYETAQHIGRNDQKGGFISPDCYDFIPYLQLCVCYDRLGDYQQAQQYNEMAGHCKPESPAYLYNKTYFAALSAASASNQS